MNLYTWEYQITHAGDGQMLRGWEPFAASYDDGVLAIIWRRRSWFWER